MSGLKKSPQNSYAVKESLAPAAFLENLFARSKKLLIFDLLNPKTGSPDKRGFPVPVFV